jgi:hypothetical protein
MTGPFRMMPEPRMDRPHDSPGGDDDDPMLMPDRLRSLAEGYAQINGPTWRPRIAYLGEHEWERFRTECMTDEWEEVSAVVRRFQYKTNCFMDVRLLVGEKRYLKMFGDKT